MLIILFILSLEIFILIGSVLVFFMVLKKIGVILLLSIYLFVCLLGILGILFFINYNIELVVDLCDELVLIIFFM